MNLGAIIVAGIGGSLIGVGALAVLTGLDIVASSISLLWRPIHYQSEENERRLRKIRRRNAAGIRDNPDNWAVPEVASKADSGHQTTNWAEPVGSVEQ